MEAALSVKAASYLLVRFFLAMLDVWGRPDVKVLLRSDQEVTLTLDLREVRARRPQRTLVERSPVERSRDHGSHGKSKLDFGRDVAHNEARDWNESWRQAGDGPLPRQLDVTTLLLDILCR